MKSISDSSSTRDRTNQSASSVLRGADPRSRGSPGVRRAVPGNSSGDAESSQFSYPLEAKFLDRARPGELIHVRGGWIGVTGAALIYVDRSRGVFSNRCETCVRHVPSGSFHFFRLRRRRNTSGCARALGGPQHHRDRPSATGAYPCHDNRRGARSRSGSRAVWWAPVRRALWKPAFFSSRARSATSCGFHRNQS